MTSWITSFNRKVHQRKLNAAIRSVNRNIERDSLWRGRFYIRQSSAQFYSYPDGSGCELWVVLQFIDRKTGATKEIAETANHFLWQNGTHLFWEMNRFIVEYCRVWEENPRPGTAEYFSSLG